ncbi:hypothetical protein BLNAU_63 [Blattamonas nauphoetae]|uniref:Uncharacterized protein n=1 Tax=Blattamonas nauphoetae TaxID=2049346 RepID=A0ABQ9YLY9_9EUKA|nr:hypothetical protein BLNAU_63 [Blattamonas nauphoetae]
MVQPTWWANTQLDFHNLQHEHCQALALLAPTPVAFYQKYVNPNNADLLKNDVQNALQTTEDYAGQFSGQVLTYFDTVWAQENRHLIPPTPMSQQFPPQVQQSPTSSLPPPMPMGLQPEPQSQPSPYYQGGQQVPTLPSQQISSGDGISRAEVMQIIERKEAEIKQTFLTQIQQLQQEVQSKNREMSDLKNAVDSMQTLIQSHFNQSSSVRPPIQPAMAQPPVSQGLYGQTPTTLPVQSYGAQPAYNTTPPQTQGYGGYGATPTNQDLLMTTDLKPEDYNSARVTGKSVQFIGPIQSRVFVDFVCLEQIITAEWKVYVYPGQNLQLGFIMDVMGDLRQESNERILVEYSNTGLLTVRNRTFNCEPFQFNDTITLEINCPERSARLFKNGKQLPYVIKRIPMVNKLYVSGTGVQNRADLMKLTQTSSPGSYATVATQEINMESV